MNRPVFDSTRITQGLIALAAILVSAWLQWTHIPADSLFADEWLRDQFARSQASSQPESRIVIVDIDESSLADAGPWPWPRARLADLVEALLHDYGAKGVALDMVLPEPADAEGDARLAALARSERLVLAQALDYVDRAAPLRIGALSGGKAASTNLDVPAASGHIANHAQLGGPHTGNIGFVPDNDGVIRRLPLYSWFEGRVYPSLSVALLECCSDRAVPPPSQVPQWQRVPFSRDFSSYTVIPASDILNLRVPVSMTAGKLVLVGSSSLGLADSVATPLLSNTSGVLVHAAMLTSLLDRSEGRAPHPWPGSLLAFLFSAVVILVSIYALPRISAILNAVLLLAASAAWIALAYRIAPHDGSFTTTGPLVSFLLLLTVAIPYHWHLSQRKSRKLLDTLNHYVAPVIVNEILSSGLKDPLAPRQQYMTTLVADMEGYTKHIEGLPLDEAASLTRQFLNCLTQPVLACRGTLDKYTGDGLVAFWGAPIKDVDHADLAIDAAVQMVQALKSLNESRAKDGKPPLRVRIGIESGDAMSGDFGSSSRSIYTAVGDSVNTASRLEDVARSLPYDIMIGPGTARSVKRHELFLIGELPLKGKQNATKVFTLKALTGSPPPAA